MKTKKKKQTITKASNVSNTTKTYEKIVKNNSRKHKNNRLWNVIIKDIISWRTFNAIFLLQIVKSITIDSNLFNFDKIYEFSLSNID